MRNEIQRKLIALVGGSGSGKSWLATQLRRALGSRATRLALDDFYLDRAHLSVTRRGAVNFDHPRAIDWEFFEHVLERCRRGHAVRLPRYSFITHTRLPQRDEFWAPGAVVLVEGLWLLHYKAIRELFDLRVFLDCPARLRLERRLARDVAERGRTAESVREQFWRTVAPMHDRFVAPQIDLADVVLNQPSSMEDIAALAARINGLGENAIASRSARLSPGPTAQGLSMPGRSPAPQPFASDPLAPCET